MKKDTKRVQHIYNKSESTVHAKEFGEEMFREMLDNPIVMDADGYAMLSDETVKKCIEKSFQWS